MDDQEIELKARVSLADYQILCETLHCPPGQAVQAMLQRAAQETDQRLFREAMLLVSKVRECRKLPQFVTWLRSSPDFHDCCKLTESHQLELDHHHEQTQPEVVDLTGPEPQPEAPLL